MRELFRETGKRDVITKRSNNFTHRCERNGEICLCGNRLLLGLRWVFIWLLYIGHHKRAINWIVKRGVLRSLISHIFETWMAVRSGVFNPKFPFFIFFVWKSEGFPVDLLMLKHARSIMCSFPFSPPSLHKFHINISSRKESRFAQKATIVICTCVWLSQPALPSQP